MFVAILGSCNGGRGTAAISEECPTCDTLAYAKGIAISHYKDYIQVDIRNPWDTAKMLNTYILVDRDKPEPSQLPSGKVVKTPIRNAIVYTSVHAAILEQLGSLDAIAGVCEPQYITSPGILSLVKAGTIADIGEATAPNIEKIIDIGGEVIICSPYENGDYGSAEKLGIPIIDAADYMETLPLARTEWIKFYGLLVGKPEKADSIFRTTSQSYTDFKQLVSTHVAPPLDIAPDPSSSSKDTSSATIESSANSASATASATPLLPRPTLLTERKYGSSWFVPGGTSYTAIMYTDAGADYIFSDHATTANVPLSPETVLDRAGKADIWIMKYALDRPMTYSDLASEYPLYTGFAPYRHRRIYACNTIRTTYYDDITIHPDYILADLIAIFHPTLLPNHQLRYFFPIATE